MPEDARGDGKTGEICSKCILMKGLIIAVAGGVICHYVIKWLDGDE